MASKAVGERERLQKNRADTPLASARFNQGDVVTTVISCANGETIINSMSIRCGRNTASLACAAVAIPDFTSGRWMQKQDRPGDMYSLDRVYQEAFED